METTYDLCIIPVIYLMVNYNILLVLYARYYLTCMHAYGYSMLWYGISTYACTILYMYCILKAKYI